MQVCAFALHPEGYRLVLRYQGPADENLQTMLTLIDGFDAGVVAPFQVQQAATRIPGVSIMMLESGTRFVRAR